MRITIAAAITAILGLAIAASLAAASAASAMVPFTYFHG